MESRVRSSNIELLRIFSMLMIIGHHFFVHGISKMAFYSDIAYKHLSMSFIKQEFLMSLFVWGGVGNGVFFFLTGYFLINSTINYSKLIKIYLQLLEYTVLFVVLFIFLYSLNFYRFPEIKKTLLVLVELLLPFSGGQWWFACVYIMLYFSAPLLNKIYQNLDRKKATVFIILLWAFGYVPCYVHTWLAGFQTGVFFYMLGGYVKLYLTNDVPSNKKFLVALIISLVFLLFATHINYICQIDSKRYSKLLVLVLNFSYFVLLIPVFVVSIFFVFKNLRIQESRIINLIASTTFGIYLFHESKIGRVLIWNKIVDCYKLMDGKFFVINVLVVVFCIFSIGSMIDCLRQKLDKKFAQSIQAKLEQFFCKTN